jgi:hypothetical protein
MNRLPEGFVDNGKQRTMNDEFGRRLRNFFEKGPWWDVVQVLKTAKVPCDEMWMFVTAGIPDMTDEDMLFAMSINWCIDRTRFELYDIDASVDGYADGNWWYKDLTDTNMAVPGSPTIAVFGKLKLATAYSDDEAQRRVKEFVHSEKLDGSGIITDAHWVDREEPETAADGLSVRGTILLK